MARPDQTDVMKSSRRRGTAIGWVVLAALAIIAILWASEPSSAHPSSSSWKPGRTAVTWDWERHWNYWRKETCKKKVLLPGVGTPSCSSWADAGKVWKACGGKIRPPDPSRINGCGIGQVGGHSRHGDGVNVRYRYLSRHEDRKGPSYNVCKADPSLPANTAPGNCGTWIRNSHFHCATDPDAHPPNCATTTVAVVHTTLKSTDTTMGVVLPTSTTTTKPRTARPSPPTTRRARTTTTARPTSPPTTRSVVTTRPPPPPACSTPGAIDEFRSYVDGLPAPQPGVAPAKNGYVRVPLRAYYQGVPSGMSTRSIGSSRVSMRIWVSSISWKITGLGRPDGTELGIQSFSRSSASFTDADSLRNPVEVRIGSAEAHFLRTSAQAGYSSGYPMTVTVVWSGECREPNATGWTHLGTRTQASDFAYRVRAIWSRPT